MSRFRATIGLAALVVLAIVLPHLVAGAQSAEVGDVGWWSNRPGAPAQPPGGFEVANGLQGEESVAALRVSFDGEITKATLTMSETGGLNQAAAGIKVCTTNAAWTPANPGPYDARPAADCAVSATATRDAATTRWTADVTVLASGDSVSLVLVPVAAPAGGALPVATPFQVTFSVASVIVEGSAPTTATTEPAVTFTPDSGFDDGIVETPVFDPGSSAFDVPAPNAPDAVVGPVVPAAPLDSAADQTGLPTAATTGQSGSRAPWWRLVLLIPISAVIGFGAIVVRRSLAERALTVAT